MKKEKDIKFDELSREYALTDDQLMEYFWLNNIKILNEDEDINLSDKNIVRILKKLKMGKNHNNKSELKSIKIEGLFGKYNYNFEFKKDIEIWVSENGVGKTTILNIIVAILTGDARMLCDIQFNKVIVNISDEKYIIDKKDLGKSYLKDGEKEFLEILNRYLPISFVYKIKKEIEENGYIENSFFNEMRYKLEKNSILQGEKIEYIINKIKDFQSREWYDELYKIKESLLNEEILFYPTYRRIEVGWERIFSSNLKKNVNRELTAKYMGFSMNDVKVRINNLLEMQRKEANKAYINMNADIISELLENKIDSYISKSGTIDMRKVDIVLKRIGEDRINDIDKLKYLLSKERLEKNESNIEFLIYYLQKLVSIYDSQKNIDRKLSRFSKVCNKYLSGKRIEYDESMLKMNVFNSEGEKIDFNDLSSGEKQVVSIFSKVYLDITSSCIFIIDEPEISLSIEWQKEFLKDIYDSEKIGLLIATTHSPFIFKNKYIDYVKELDLYKEKINVTKR